MIPVSSFQFSTLHQCPNVPRAHHVSRPKPKPHKHSKATFSRILSRGFSPQQQCSTMVVVSMSSVRQETAVSCWQVASSVSYRLLGGRTGCTHDDERPRDRPSVVPQVPVKVEHDRANDERREQLGAANTVEKEDRVVRRGDFRLRSGHLGVLLSRSFRFWE